MEEITSFCGFVNYAIFCIMKLHEGSRAVTYTRQRTEHLANFIFGNHDNFNNF